MKCPLPFSLLLFACSMLQCGGQAVLSSTELAEFRAAMTLYRERRFPEAQRRLEALRKSQPNDLEAQVLLARAYFYGKRPTEAEELLRGMLKKRPGNPYASLWLGRVLMVRPDGAQAASRVFRGVLRNDPENARAHYYLGRCLELEGKTKEALMAYQRALMNEQQLSRTHLQSARLLTRLQLPERAQKHASSVTRLAVSNHDMAEAARLMQGKNQQ